MVSRPAILAFLIVLAIALIAALRTSLEEEAERIKRVDESKWAKGTADPNEPAPLGSLVFFGFVKGIIAEDSLILLERRSHKWLSSSVASKRAGRGFGSGIWWSP